MTLGKLTAFATTRIWLDMNDQGRPFDVCTWLDSRREQQVAKVVIGPWGADKHAWSNSWWDPAVISNPSRNMLAIDWAGRYVYDVPVGAVPPQHPTAE